MLASRILKSIEGKLLLGTSKAPLAQISRAGFSSLSRAPISLRARAPSTFQTARAVSVLQAAHRSFSTAATTPSAAPEVVPAGPILERQDLVTNIARSLPHLLAKYNLFFSECWLPTNDQSEFLFVESWSADKDINSRLSVPNWKFLIPNTSDSVLGKSFRTKAAQVGAVAPGDIPPTVRNFKDFDDVKSGVVVPVIYRDTVVALIKLYAKDKRDFSPELLDNMQRFTNGIFIAGVFKGEVAPVWDEPADIPKGQMNEVFRRIIAEQVFNASHVYSEVDWFYHLGLQKYYFQRYSPADIARHVHSFIASKKLAAATGQPEDIWLDIQNRTKEGVTLSALYMSPTDHGKMAHIETRLQEKIAKIPNSMSYTVEYFQSENPIVPGGTKKLGLYALQTSNWANPAKLGSNDNNIWEVASELFLRDKTKAIRDRYQEIANVSLRKLSPVAEVFDTYRDGTIPVMFSFLQSTGTTTSYMLQLTELLKHNNLTAHRKFIETFANGLIVYSLYLKPTAGAKENIAKLVKQFSMLHLVPQSALTPLFLNGQWGAELYTYASAGAKFIYYFLNKRSEEFNQLASALKTDTLNLGRLRLLQNRLKREAVSRERIFSCLLNPVYSSIVAELYDHFQVAATTNKPAADVLKNVSLANKIKTVAVSDVDQQILSAFLMFNQHILKTNFYNKSKSSLSFRLNPQFLADSDYPAIPYGLFFVMGSDFQGFHVRFSDIARGGIRVIRSADLQAYNHNLESQFQENYGLAFTQNLKNKDIPEFGSKGTILLNPGATNSFLPFQKYISGLLDLMIKYDDIVDNYGKEELLFLGPDEGTADYMQWAAQYAQKRGYRFWRSFTTGKPPALGGIPHDTYGMTTRGVHRYVLNCLDKLGLDESKVTKIQTGGPDGDLGSNEILLSKDKTKAIVDGSGVIFDPNGLDRTELVRLAKQRQMIANFDLSKLTKGAFRVLTKDTNVTLPHGEVVESGLRFRNNFHFHPLAVADMFVPCGGRPESVNLTNVNQWIDEKGKPRFKIIVEGANLFFTQDARLVLEKAGVVLYKDASANKGGVTSSSLEVLAALSLTDEEFKQHMAVVDPKQIPQFYSDYVAEVQQRIETDANLEFECIWREHQRTKIHRYLLTDQVSNKINDLNDFIQASSLWHNDALKMSVLGEAVPKKLQTLVGLDNVVKRVPEAYTRAIFGAFLSSRYVYKHGLNAHELAFFTYMQPYLRKN